MNALAVKKPRMKTVSLRLPEELVNWMNWLEVSTPYKMSGLLRAKIEELRREAQTTGQISFPIPDSTAAPRGRG